MGITGTVSTFETVYGALRTGSTAFSSSRTSSTTSSSRRVRRSPSTARPASGRGEGLPRSAGDRERRAQTGLGGGVSGLDDGLQRSVRSGPADHARTNHALYISHYPLGRDATVDYPVSISPVNDTKHWLLLRTYVGRRR
jgi:hypothetical protein